MVVFFMKRLKIILIIIGIILIVSLINNKETRSNEVRVRILANSNEGADQAEKYYLKNILVPILKKHNEPPQLEVIKQELFEALEKQDLPLNNKIKLEYQVCAYSAQTYQDEFIPAGKYLTLLITIGSGEGKNWWTVLYPEFFGVAFEDEDHNIEYRSYFYDKFIKK